MKWIYCNEISTEDALPAIGNPPVNSIPKMSSMGDTNKDMQQLTSYNI